MHTWLERILSRACVTNEDDHHFSILLLLFFWLRSIQLPILNIFEELKLSPVCLNPRYAVSGTRWCPAWLSCRLDVNGCLNEFHAIFVRNVVECTAQYVLGTSTTHVLYFMRTDRALSFYFASCCWPMSEDIEENLNWISIYWERNWLLIFNMFHIQSANSGLY